VAALVAVTVAVKVTNWPKVDGLSDEVSEVVVLSVYWAVPEYRKWKTKFLHAS
jgi:hypothetical protein